MTDRERFSPPLVGVSSLLVIFAVLCLTVFSLLSVSTVQAGRRLSENTAAAIEGYARADCAAEETLARLRAGEHPAGVTEQDGICRYSCPISDTQILAVEVMVDGSTYTILRWQAVSAADWQAEDSLPVWDGGAE